jgi:hypothetical protein
MTKSDIILALVSENIPYSYEGKTKTFHIAKHTDAMLPANDFKMSVSLFDKKAVEAVKISRIAGEAVGFPSFITNKRGRIVAISHGKVIGYKSLPVVETIESVEELTNPEN